MINDKAVSINLGICEYYVLTSLMNTLPQVVMMECSKEYRKIVDYTRMGKMPDSESQENVSLKLRLICL